MRPACRMRPMYAIVLPVLSALLLFPLSAVRGDSFSDAFPAIPESDWVGLRLIVLPQSKSLQRYGYQEMYRDTDKNYVPLRYADYVGRIARVVEINHGKALDGEIFEEAKLQFEDNKETVNGDIDHGCMNDVAPVSDLEEARKLYLGKTLWLSEDHLSTYNPDKDLSASPKSAAWRAAFGKVPVKQFSPVRVMDIVPGWYASAPVRFIVEQAAGKYGAKRKLGYVDVHISDTNIPEDQQDRSRFEDTFLETDPRKSYGWSPKVWAAIENKEVFAGMTAQQVRMSWGEPKQINQTPGKSQGEYWIYDPKHILLMSNGKVIKTHE